MNTNQEYQEVVEAVRNITIELNSFQEADISNLKVPIICIYSKPNDYKNKIIARMFDLEEPLNIIIVRYTIEEIREDIIKTFPNMVRFDRAVNDTKSITETWI